MDPAENARKKGVSSYDPPIQSRMGGSVTATPPFFLRKAQKSPLGSCSHFQKSLILYYLFFTVLSYNLVYCNIFEWEGYACHQF